MIESSSIISVSKWKDYLWNLVYAPVNVTDPKNLLGNNNNIYEITNPDGSVFEVRSTVGYTGDYYIKFTDNFATNPNITCITITYYKDIYKITDIYFYTKDSAKAFADSISVGKNVYMTEAAIAVIIGALDPTKISVLAGALWGLSEYNRSNLISNIYAEDGPMRVTFITDALGILYSNNCVTSFTPPKLFVLYDEPTIADFIVN